MRMRRPGHVARMREMNSYIIVGKPEGKSPHGRDLGIDGLRHQAEKNIFFHLLRLNFEMRAKTTCFVYFPNNFRNISITFIKIGMKVMPLVVTAVMRGRIKTSVLQCKIHCNRSPQI
jgi:hypothetical protein